MLSLKWYRIVGVCEILIGIFLAFIFSIIFIFPLLLVGLIRLFTPESRINKFTDWSIKSLFLIIGLELILVLFLGVVFGFTGEGSLGTFIISFLVAVSLYFLSLILMIIGLIKGNKK